MGWGWTKSQQDPSWESAAGETGRRRGVGRKPRCPFKPKLPREPFTPHSPAPAQGVRPPTSQPVKCQTGLNSPRSGAELGRPGPPGPWPHLGWGGRERGVPEPPLDVKALKGPMSPAPRLGPAPSSRIANPSSAWVRAPPSSVQMFPGRELSLPGRRAPLPPPAPVGRASPPPLRRNSPRLAGADLPDLPSARVGDARLDRVGLERGYLKQRELSRFLRAHGHARLLLWVWACTCMWFRACL